MNKTAEYLDKCKEKLNISSTYRLAKVFDVDETGIRNYYAGRRVPDDYVCFKIAETLEIDPSYVIAQIKAESEKNEKKREYFRSFGGASRKAAANIIMGVLLSFICLGGLTASGGKPLFLKRRHFA